MPKSLCKEKRGIVLRTFFPKRQVLGEVVDNQYHPAYLLHEKWETAAGHEARRGLASYKRKRTSLLKEGLEEKRAT